MQSHVVIFPFLDQFDQSWEHAFIVHQLEGSFIVAAVEEEKGDDEVERIRRVFLDMHRQRG